MERENLRSIFDEQTLDAILAIHLSTNSEKDSYRWTDSKSGCYSVKSANSRIRDAEQQQNVNQASYSCQTSRTLWT